MLRKTLMYHKPGFYYAGVFANFVLRFAWVLLIIPFPFEAIPSMWQGFSSRAMLLPILVLLELCRRFIWSLFAGELTLAACWFAAALFVPVADPFFLSLSPSRCAVEAEHIKNSQQFQTQGSSFFVPVMFDDTSNSDARRATTVTGYNGACALSFLRFLGVLPVLNRTFLNRTFLCADAARRRPGVRDCHGVSMHASAWCVSALSHLPARCVQVIDDRRSGRAAVLHSRLVTFPAVSIVVRCSGCGVRCQCVIVAVLC